MNIDAQSRLETYVDSNLCTVWWRYIGFAPSNAGSLCYYGSGGHKNDRALVQFIPRYVGAPPSKSRLFARPNLIHL